MTPWAEPGAHVAILLAALAWDRFVGEPPGWAHPVVWMGKVVGWIRRRAPRTPMPAFLAGLALALLLPLGVGCLAYGVTSAPWLGGLFGVWLLTSSFAIRGLLEAGSTLADCLDDGQLDLARARLAWLCSRDARDLDETALAAGALESVAENSSDSAVAPLLWFFVGGVPGAVAYRAVNTLDAMIGYRGGDTEWFGKASARPGRPHEPDPRSPDRAVVAVRRRYRRWPRRFGRSRGKGAHARSSPNSESQRRLAHGGDGRAGGGHPHEARALRARGGLETL